MGEKYAMHLTTLVRITLFPSRELIVSVTANHDTRKHMEIRIYGNLSRTMIVYLVYLIQHQITKQSWIIFL